MKQLINYLNKLPWFWSFLEKEKPWVEEVAVVLTNKKKSEQMMIDHYCDTIKNRKDFDIELFCDWVWYNPWNGDDIWDKFTDYTQLQSVFSLLSSIIARNTSTNPYKNSKFTFDHLKELYTIFNEFSKKQENQKPKLEGIRDFLDFLLIVGIDFDEWEQWVRSMKEKYFIYDDLRLQKDRLNNNEFLRSLCLNYNYTDVLFSLASKKSKLSILWKLDKLSQRNIDLQKSVLDKMWNIADCVNKIHERILLSPDQSIAVWDILAPIRPYLLQMSYDDGMRFIRAIEKLYNVQEATRHTLISNSQTFITKHLRIDKQLLSHEEWSQIQIHRNALWISIVASLPIIQKMHKWLDDQSTGDVGWFKTQITLDGVIVPTMVIPERNIWTTAHEYTHMLNSYLFPPAIEDNRHDKKATALYRSSRSLADEILAYTRNGAPPETIRAILTKSQSEWWLYDYCMRYKNKDYYNNLVEEFNPIREKLLGISDRLHSFLEKYKMQKEDPRYNDKTVENEINFSNISQIPRTVEWNTTITQRNVCHDLMEEYRLWGHNYYEWKNKLLTIFAIVPHEQWDWLMTIVENNYWENI